MSGKAISIQEADNGFIVRCGNPPVEMVFTDIGQALAEVWWLFNPDVMRPGHDGSGSGAGG